MLGSELTTALLWYGYTQGAFPMTMDNGTVEWFQPRLRALLPIQGIHVSTSLRRLIRREEFEIRYDTCFEHVMRSCLRPSDNWISDDFIRVYGEAHQEGWGHCVECWKDGELVGGAYGLAVGQAFCAESMFHRATNASKVALWALVEKCRDLGFQLIDAQIMNSHLRTLGAYEVTHSEYLRLLAAALRERTEWSQPRRPV